MAQAIKQGAREGGCKGGGSSEVGSWVGSEVRLVKGLRVAEKSCASEQFPYATKQQLPSAFGGTNTMAKRMKLTGDFCWSATRGLNHCLACIASTLACEGR